jgi:NADP-dependent aldehyde dehydrogenase
MIEETSKETIDRKIQKATEAYQFLKNSTIMERAALMNAIADKIESLGDELLETAHAETSLPMTRPAREKATTLGQWRGYS